MAGAAILVIEVAGTRVMGPFYGVTLYTWSALIGVTLTSLSVGYVLGGRVADARPKHVITQLGRLFVAAGVWVGLSAWLGRELLRLLEPVGLRAAVLLGASGLFGPPLTALAMVSPLLLKLMTRRVKHLGRTAGNLYAVSTVAGVTAALATGFFLIPELGVKRLLGGVAAGLLLTGIWLWWADRASRGPIMLVALITCVAALALAERRTSPLVQTVRHSAYGELRVIDDSYGGRHLFIDGGVHSSVELGSWQSLQRYIWVIDSVRHGFAEPGSALVIGLGAGSTHRGYRSAGWQVKSVEIDPVVIELAERHFGFEGEVVEADARRFLREELDTFDVIVLDAFSSNSLPTHLFTREAFALVRGRLRRGGVFAMNIESIGWRSEVVDAITATLAKHFEHRMVLPVDDEPEGLTNLVVLASDQPIRVPRRLSGPFADDQANAWRRRYVPDREGVVLSDDFSPLDRWSEGINLASRRALHDSLDGTPMAGLAW